MIAAAEGHAETVCALVESGADVNAANALGRTALMFALMAAVHNGHIEVIRALLDHRADVSIKDKQGQPALAWAEAQGKVELAQALRDSTAKK